jgi:hypothetical protein
MAQDSVQPKQWEQGKGWGWVWGDDDQLGNLNELSPELTLKALSRVDEGKVYDLGLMYDRNSYRFEGHNPGEIISFRTPDGLNTQEDIDFVTSEEDNSLNTTWASNALFISIKSREYKNLRVRVPRPAGGGRGRAAGGSKGLRGCQRSRIDVAVHLS